MNVKDENLVIVRGVNSDWIQQNFLNMWIGFGGSPQAIPKDDAFYVGLYLEAPISAVSHIGIVDRIERNGNDVDFYLKALIKLTIPVKTADGHAIRKHENWKLTDFRLNVEEMNILRNSIRKI